MDEAVPRWDPGSAAVRDDQLGAYDRMRSTCPIAASNRGVTFFRHADVVAAANDPERFSSAVSERRSVPNSIDPPEHARWRALVDRFFDAERMAALEPRVQRIAEAVVESVPRGSAVDAVTEIGRPLAVTAQTDWLGWHGAERRLLDWMDANHAATRSGDRQRMAAVAAAFDEIVAEQVDRRRSLGDKAPDDPTTELVRSSFDGRPLTDQEVVSILRNWTAGDLGSVAAAIGVVCHFVATNPDVQADLRAGIGDEAAAVDEMLRLDDPFLTNRRVTTEAVDVGGYRLPAGTHVVVNWASANRDEEVFGDPDGYRPIDHASSNVVYGTGIHVCPGRPLATLELVSTLRALLDATTSLDLASGADAVRETDPVGGWRHLPIVVH